MTRILRHALVLSGLSLASSAFAIFEADLARAPEQDRTSSQALALNLSPIPMVPLSVGASFSGLTSEVSGETKDAKTDRLSLQSAAAELKIWSPMPIFYITPYLRANYTVWGRYSMKGQDQTEDPAVHQGLRGHSEWVGLSVMPVRMLKVFAEIGQSRFEFNNGIDAKDQIRIGNLASTRTVRAGLGFSI